jgi:uncharacterized protein with NRDE domain
VCLLAIAHRATSRFPLVIAANRDEDYQRPTYEAHPWEAAPDVVGGVDGLQGGSWLAVRRGGRFAAVTNLRGAERRKRSRGFLVRDFVTSDVSPEEYAERIAGDAADYPGFHLLAGDVDGTLMYIAPELQTPLAPGVHAFSNAPHGEEWPKVRAAIEKLEGALAITEEEPLMDELLRFLCSPRGTAAVESEVFIPGERYGTRSSTVIVASQTEILFAEQSFGSGGVPHGSRRLFCLVR